jgi:Flp pilus assembly protein TadD
LAKILLEEANLDASIQQFEEAIRLRPSWPEAYNYLGIALAQKGETEKAVTTFQKALKLNPQYREAQENLTATLKQGSAPPKGSAPH